MSKIVLRKSSVCHFGSRWTTIASIILVIAGCEQNGAFSAYSNYELKNAYAACKSENLSPGGAQRCRNIEKECQKRKKERGLRC